MGSVQFMADAYLPRLVDRPLAELLRDVPGVLLLGARATGKTTTAARHAVTVVRLDRPAEAEAFRADPDAALARLAEPVLLDEWQVVPDVLGAVKRAIDRDPKPGRFLVSGSVRDDLVAGSWPVTGRVIRVELGGLTVRELHRGDLRRAGFLERLATGDLAEPDDPPDLVGYLELAVRGGYPEPVLRLPPGREQEWMRSYLDRLLTHDITEIDAPRDPARLARFFEAYALNTAGEVTDQALVEAAGINRRTAVAYERLLTALLLVEALPAWSSDRLKRLVRAPKRYVRDPGLAATAVGAGVDDLLRHGDLLGRLLDTFVLSQLRAEVALYAAPPRLFHLRQESGAREVDIVAELGFRRVVGIEVKARSAVTREHARHLIWLREQLGDDFAGGVVLHTGPRTYAIDDRITAAPIAAMWS
jgi:predicted AAA+ superfamily ATPase